MLPDSPKYARSETENCRNGNYTKNLITENGSIDLNIPRARQIIQLQIHYFCGSPENDTSSIYDGNP
ncbi:MAG: transposase [Candidatus Lariskella arthropodorum]